MPQVRRLLMVVLVLLVMAVIPGMAHAQDGGQVTHTVQAGENLYRIALRYGVTLDALAQANNITNPNLILVGQVLIIPGAVAEQPTVTPTAVPTVTGTPATATPTQPATLTPTATTAPPATPTPTSVPPVAGEVVHVVQPGENLFRIALKYNLSTAVVAAYNGIPNPNLIIVGQKIRIPPGTYAAVPEAAAPASAEVTPTVVMTPTPLVPPQSEAENVGFAYGAEVFLPEQDTTAVVGAASDLGVEWVKQEIDWAMYESAAGTIDWDAIDAMVASLDEAGLNILLTVGGAPAWARDTSVDVGPPSDYATYAAFVGAMAERYEGQVDAYEIWSEPNLQSMWNSPNGLSAASYVELLRLAYVAIKSADPAAVVVTAGLAPTGVNDGVAAIDDRVYLRQMYAAGAADWSDAVGAHPSGWANPPDSTCCRNTRPAVPGWDDHPSFFFKETLSDYRSIMVQNGDSGTYIWATKFGWGSNDGLNITPDETFYGFVTYTSLDEQSQYILRGFQLGAELGYVGPMFVWNLNYCEAFGVTDPQCLWSLLDPAGNPRPAYLALEGVLAE